jgi:hypothetical protein
MIATLFFPFWEESSMESKEVVTINAFELVYAQTSDLVGPTVISTKPTWYISVLAILAAAVAMFSIFQYKNRLRQIQLGARNSLLMGGNIALVYYFSTKGEPIIANHQGDFLFGFFIVAAGLFFNALANRFIRNDEKLVKSADRIR